MGTVATTYYPTNINVPRFDWASTAQLPQNLLTYSNDFTNAAWQKASITTSYGVTGPTGAADATTITAGANNVYMYQSAARTNAGSTTYTASIWVRRRTGTGLIQIIAPNGSTATTIAPTSDWTRFSVTGLGNSNGTTYAPQVYIGTSGDALDVYGGQLEVGTSTTEYKQTGAFTPTNTPLLPASTCNGLLIEESRANRILWCRDASQSNWTKTNVTAAKDQTGIDGVANAASSLTATADNGTCIQTITLASGSRTASVYLKRITGTGNVQVSFDGSTWSTVDLSSAEWRRIVLSGTVTNPVVGIRLATNGDAVAMDYAQVEDGAFATTPILTTTASATRAIDNRSIDGVVYNNAFSSNSLFSILYSGDSNGVAANTNSTYFYAIVNSAKNTEYIISQVSGTTLRINGLALNAALPQQNVPWTSIISVSPSKLHKGEINYGSTTSSPAATYTSIPYPLAAAFQFGGSNGNACNGRVKRVIVFQSDLTQDQMKALAKNVY